MEDGNRVTKVKYAGTLVVHWTKPLLRQHRCPRESSGPDGRYANRYGQLVTEYRLSPFKRESRDEQRFFTIFFFIYIYERKKERNTKRKEIDESRGEIVRCVRLSKISWRKENLFFGKKKKMKFLSTLDVASLLCPCKILHSLFLDTDFASFGRINNREDCISRAIFLAR